MSTWSMTNMQDANSPTMEHMIMFHDHTLMINTLIISMVCYMLILIYIKSYFNRTIMQNQTLEFIWTFLPMILLVFLAFPSVKILYLSDETLSPTVTIKTIGHQWYWTYEYSDFKETLEYDSFMVPIEESKINNYRLLEVNNRTIIPMSIQTRLLVTSTDVIHSWTMPSMGVKIDATPGRMNQISVISQRPGIFSGQCSEICGANHSFMPIMVEVTNMELFISWIKFLMS
uniref:Cytochrome c oxidase subunit 2 n=1 Tax=Janus sp. 1 GYN-2022e TaxID=3003421 RepID=A0A9E8YXE6_9HYME|nr:cytochrome c oxidase subunit II [Janus sp. 1 GYN-2022e]